MRKSLLFFPKGFLDDSYFYDEYQLSLIHKWFIQSKVNEDYSMVNSLYESKVNHIRFVK